MSVLNPMKLLIEILAGDIIVIPYEFKDSHIQLYTMNNPSCKLVEPFIYEVERVMTDNIIVKYVLAKNILYYEVERIK